MNRQHPLAKEYRVKPSPESRLFPEHPKQSFTTEYRCGAKRYYGPFPWDICEQRDREAQHHPFNARPRTSRDPYVWEQSFTDEGILGFEGTLRMRLDKVRPTCEELWSGLLYELIPPLRHLSSHDTQKRISSNILQEIMNVLGRREEGEEKDCKFFDACILILMDLVRAVPELLKRDRYIQGVYRDSPTFQVLDFCKDPNSPYDEKKYSTPLFTLDYSADHRQEFLDGIFSRDIFGRNRHTKQDERYGSDFHLDYPRYDFAKRREEVTDEEIMAQFRQEIQQKIKLLKESKRREHSTIRTRFTIGGAQFEAVGFLQSGEDRVDLKEIFKRCEKDSPAINTKEDLKLIWKNRKQLPAELRGYVLITKCPADRRGTQDVAALAWGESRNAENNEEGGDDWQKSSYFATSYNGIQPKHYLVIRRIHSPSDSIQA